MVSSITQRNRKISKESIDTKIFIMVNISLAIVSALEVVFFLRTLQKKKKKNQNQISSIAIRIVSLLEKIWKKSLTYGYFHMDTAWNRK